MLVFGAVFLVSSAFRLGFRGVFGRVEAALELGLEFCVWGCKFWFGLVGS